MKNEQLAAIEGLERALERAMSTVELGTHAEELALDLASRLDEVRVRFGGGRRRYVFFDKNHVPVGYVTASTEEHARLVSGIETDCCAPLSCLGQEDREAALARGQLPGRRGAA